MNQPKNQKAQVRTEIPGPRSRELRRREEKYIAPGLQGFALMAGIAVESARGSAVTDADGNTFLDLIGGIGVGGIGHSHPGFVEAVKSQAEKVAVGSFTSQARVELLEELAKLNPYPRLNRLQLYSSGAEAVESALRLAKCRTGKDEFVSFWGGFHGKTMGALSLMGSEFKKGLGPMVPGAHIVPYAHCYRCPLKLKYPSCGLACVDAARKQLKHAAGGRVAAVIVEPMQGTAGNVIPPPEFLGAIQSLAHELGALLIADEMITGFGRTGRVWGSQRSDVEPDVITLGKQFGGGFPISGVLTSEAVADSPPWSAPSGSSSSYGGNPLAAAAAAATLKIIREERLAENSAKVGVHLLKGLRETLEPLEFVGEVRGEGLFLAVEFVKDKASREPLPVEACRRIFNSCLKKGLLTMSYAPSFRIQPAMTLDEGTADAAVALLSEAIGEVAGGIL